MAKAKLKTQNTEKSVASFLGSITDKNKRSDSEIIVKLMTEVTKHEPKMWGSAIIGFGDRHMVYESGRELDWFHIGFSPRKQNLTLYLPGAVRNIEVIEKLGKYKTGKGCLYINSVEDIDLKVLKKLIIQSFKDAHNQVQGK